jgi:hypothetical protein
MAKQVMPTWPRNLPKVPSPTYLKSSDGCPLLARIASTNGQETIILPVYKLSRLVGPVHAAPAQACERPVSRKRFRANQA